MKAGHLGFAGVVLFWGLMNGLLWRAEFGAARHSGTVVATGVVLDRILTAPDASSLEAVQGGRRVGFVHWYPDPGETSGGAQPLESDYVPEGMVPKARGYAVRMEGQVYLDTWDQKIRFGLELKLASDRALRDLALQMSIRSHQVDLRADMARQELRWRTAAPGFDTERTVSFADLRDPRRLMEGLEGNLALVLTPWLTALGGAGDRAGGVEWQARTDVFRIGHSPLRAYRLELRAGDRVWATVRVNRAGEVLQVDLPGGLKLSNGQLTGL